MTTSNAAAAQRTAEGQDIVTNGLLERINAESGVDIDEELALLTALQTVYAANARVMSVTQDMMDLLTQL